MTTPARAGAAPAFIAALAAVAIASCATVGPSGATSLYRRIARSAVIVEAEHSTGSGTVIASEPGVLLVLTAHHVVAAGPKALRIVLADPSLSPDANAPAVIVAVDADHDLALLLAETSISRPPLPIARHEPALYEPLYSVAAPLGLGGTASPALLSSKAIRHGESDLWEITGFTFFGSSGGTLANAQGELVAVPIRVASMGTFPVPDVGFCVPLPAIRQFLARTVPELDL